MKTKEEIQQQAERLASHCIGQITWLGVSNWLKKHGLELEVMPHCPLKQLLTKAFDDELDLAA